MAAYLNLHGSADDYVALLTFVGGELNVAALRLLVINAFYIKRLGHTVLKFCRQSVIYHAVCFLNLNTLAIARDCVRFQFRTLALYYIRHIDIESKRASVNKCKAEVVIRILARQVLINRHIGKVRHSLGRNTLDVAQFLDSSGNFADFQVKSCNLSIHNSNAPS